MGRASLSWTRGKNPTLGTRAKSLVSSNQAVGCVWRWDRVGTETDRLENKGKRSRSRNLVSDWQRWQGAHSPRSAEWLAQPAGATKEHEVWLPNLCKFQYGQALAWPGDRSEVISQVQQMEQPTFRVDWIKNAPTSYVNFGSQRSCDKDGPGIPEEMLLTQGAPFHRASASRLAQCCTWWLSMSEDEIQFFQLGGSPLELQKLESSSCARVKPKLTPEICQESQN